MLRRLIFILVVAGSAWGQGACFPGQALTSRQGFSNLAAVVPGATITVSPGPLYTDQTLSTVLSTSPTTTADAYGNYQLCAAPSTQAVTVNGPNMQTLTYRLTFTPLGNVTLSGNNNFTGNNIFSGSNIFTGTTTTANINNIIYFDGVKYTTIQSAINALPTGGGTVLVPAGNYTGPTSFPPGTRMQCTGSSLWLQNVATAITGAVISVQPNSCILTYASGGLSIVTTNNIQIDGFVLDMKSVSNGTNLVLQNVSYSDFNMLVNNCSTGASANPCVTLTSINGTSQSQTQLNRFRLLATVGGSESLNLKGFSTGSTAGVTENFFDRVILVNPQLSSTSGNYFIDFVQWCDSNHFERVGFWQTTPGVTTQNGIIYNSSSSSTDNDAMNEWINWLDFTSATVTAGALLTFNPSEGNYVGVGVCPTALCPGGVPAVTNGNAALVNYSLSVYGVGTNPGGTQQLYTGNIFMNTDTGKLPEAFWQKGGVTKWIAYDDGSDNWNLNNGTNNLFTLSKTLGGGFSIAGGTSGVATIVPASTAGGQIIIPNFNGTASEQLFTGTTALPTGALAANTCSSAVTVSTAGVTTSEHITFNLASTPVGVNGYGNSPVTLFAWLTTNNVNFIQCATTAVTPGTMSLNWVVTQ